METVPETTCRAVNLSRNGVVVARHVEVADSSPSRRRGLRGRAELRPGEGFFLTPCEWVHTFGMRFCIDVAFLSSTGVVLAVQHGLKPNRLSRLVWRARGVLELPAGTLRDTQTACHDIVQLVCVPAGHPVSW